MDKKWWEISAKRVEVQAGGAGAPPEHTARFLYWMTHGPYLEPIVFWVTPDNEVEIVGKHSETPDVGTRTVENGWLRGRYARIPRDGSDLAIWFIQNQKAGDRVSPATPEQREALYSFFRITGGKLVCMLYPDSRGITTPEVANGFTHSETILRKIVIGGRKMPDPFESSTLIYLSSSKKDSVFLGDYGTMEGLVDSPRDDSEIFEAYEREQSTRQRTPSLSQEFHTRYAVCDSCHNSLPKSDMVRVDGPKVWGNICPECMNEAEKEDYL